MSWRSRRRGTDHRCTDSNQHLCHADVRCQRLDESPAAGLFRHVSQRARRQAVRGRCQQKRRHGPATVQPIQSFVRRCAEQHHRGLVFDRLPRNHLADAVRFGECSPHLHPRRIRAVRQRLGRNSAGTERVPGPPSDLGLVRRVVLPDARAQCRGPRQRLFRLCRQDGHLGAVVLTTEISRQNAIGRHRSERPTIRVPAVDRTQHLELTRPRMRVVHEADMGKMIRRARGGQKVDLGLPPKRRGSLRYLLSTLVTCGGGSSAPVWLRQPGRNARLLECCRRSRGRRITADRGVAARGSTACIT